MSSRSCRRVFQHASQSFASRSRPQSQTSCRSISQLNSGDARRGPASRIYTVGRSNTWSRARECRVQTRGFGSTSILQHGHLQPPRPGEERHVTFIDKDGTTFPFTVSDGDNLLDIAQANDLEMEGACGGSCACSTCHVIVDSQELYDKMEEPDDDENDMLDLAFGLTETSRLGCQVKMSKELDGLVVRLPSMTRNLQASDFVERKKEGG